MIRFSALVNRLEVPPNRLYRLKEKILQQGENIHDLTAGNVTISGPRFPAAILKKALVDAIPKTAMYKPDPMGQKVAREAVSRYYDNEGVSIHPDHIIMTPGTSISYFYAFKLLANPGDEILCPCPSYPLFDTIAAICGVKLVPYLIRETRRWEIDMDQLESAVTPKTKAVVLISPHNPTGSVATAVEVRALARLAERHHLAIVSDEVFSPFVFSGSYGRPAGSGAPLVMTLNGLSKMLALPGMKIGWMGMTGEPQAVKRALKSLDMISDTFLPVQEIAQFALPSLLSESKAFLDSYRAEIFKRYEFTTRLIKNCSGVSCLTPEGGIYITVRIEDPTASEERIALTLLRRFHILVHPGYYYDMPGEHLVFSYMSQPELLRKTIETIPSL